MLMWENKVERSFVNDMTEDKLDALGKEGWMLVYVFPMANNSVSENCFGVYYFRRPLNKLYQDAENVNTVIAHPRQD